jgi:hypothetical protein
MSRNEDIHNPTPATASATATAAPADPATLIAQVRAMREVIPDYTHLPVPARQSLRAVASTDPDFVRASINSVSESPNVQQALGRTPEDLRQDLADVLSWTDLEDEVRALLDGVAAANLVRRNRVGEAALATYAIARRLVRDKQHANLLPHVATMKQLNRFGVKRVKATPAPAPTPAPTPHVQLQPEEQS